MKVLTVDYRASDAASKFCESLRNTGFAVLSNHPIPEQLIEQVYADWQSFFHSDEKVAFTHRPSTQDGYFPFRTETAKNHKISDLKEFYHFYPDGRKPPQLEAISLKMYQSLQHLSVELLQWIETFLPKEISSSLSMPLRDMIDASPNTLLRILHYPPLEEEYETEAVRAAPHEDINLITLLPAATSPGLQVKDIVGNWHEVSCDPGNIVVNVGDMLQLCTNQYYKSTTHRVVNPNGAERLTSRYSMPLFLHPRPEVSLTANRTAEEYLYERLKEIGIY